MGWVQGYAADRMVEVAEAELEPIIELLRERHASSSDWRWGFNTARDDPGRARVHTEDGIDLDAIVAEVRRRQSH